jgi:hypothetical protein
LDIIHRDSQVPGAASEFEPFSTKIVQALKPDITFRARPGSDLVIWFICRFHDDKTASIGKETKNKSDPVPNARRADRRPTAKVQRIPGQN